MARTTSVAPRARRAPSPTRPSVRPAALRGLAVLGALFPALCACGHGATLPSMERPPAPVAVMTTTATDVPVYIDSLGKCMASEVVDVRPQISGKITEILFQDGAELKARDPLFTIDPRPYRARLDEARAKHASSEAEVSQTRAARETAAARVGTAKSKREEARAQTLVGRATAEAAHGEVTAAEADSERAAEDLKRFERVGESGAASAQEADKVRADARSAAARLGAARRREAAALALTASYEAAEKSSEDGIREAESLLAEAEAKIASAQAGVAEAAAAIESAQLDVEYCSIVSPIAGRAGRRLADVGNVVSANGGSLLLVQKLDPIHVEFTVTESELGAVQRNMARGTLAVEVRLPDEPGSPAPGTLTFLDSAVQEATGTVRLRATVGNADHRFWPGRFVRVRLVLDRLPGAILAPVAASQVSSMGTYVYVVKADSTAEMRPVALGQRQGDLVVVTKGLAAGERVVVQGHIGVMPGGKVRVEETPPPGPAPAAPSAAMGS